ncbi:hypothetical protein [Noviherbaspirillum massiliense]|uniref:hypothetical protein n=1 Tax=Noviherbaspirillum massiliense TaxID=1465823 RepID=UPI0002DED90E|nr:hypothetical protein [Noviherbaspirillum massiliense]
MDALLLELVLWGGLLFFFWALKDGLGRVESDIESLKRRGKRQKGHLALRSGFDHPESVTERIGSYKGAAIYRFAKFDGRCYEFDRACPEEYRATVRDDELYVEPGLVYAPLRPGALPSPAA